MTEEVNIFDFETPFEASIKRVFVANDLVCYDMATENAPTTDGFTGKEFQRERPRTEIMFLNGDSTGFLLPEVGIKSSPGFSYEMTFSGNLQIVIVTECKMSIHAAYRARVRKIMATICRQINGVEPMTKHFVQSVKTAGTTPVGNYSDGFYQSSLIYAVEWSFQADVLRQLTQ